MRLSVGDTTWDLDPSLVIVAGFTGRNQDEVRLHLHELADLGVPIPASIPSFYPVPPELITDATALTTWSAETSGEAEIAIIDHQGTRLVSLASDHTDRAMETVDIHAAKLACTKPFATRAWRFGNVADHWDELQLRSWIDGDVLYQDGTAAQILGPEELIELAQVPSAETTVLLTGTVPAIGGIRPSASFRAELFDPVLDRRISLSYTIEVVAYPT